MTDNGTSLAGFVSVDLGGLLSRKDRRELFEIERCPDKAASIKMRFTSRMASERQRTRVRMLNTDTYLDSDPEDDPLGMRPITIARSVTPRS